MVDSVTGRADAIARGKRLSLQYRRQKVLVRSTDERVSIELRGGELLSFQSRTR